MTLSRTDDPGTAYIASDDMVSRQAMISKNTLELADRLRRLARQIENGEVNALLATVFHADGQIERLDDLGLDCRKASRFDDAVMK